MDRRYSRALYTVFETELAASCPQFKRVTRKTENGRAYAWQAGSTHLFLFLRESAKGHAKFYCEFGWSHTSWPSNDRTGFSFPIQDPASAYQLPEMVAGIQCLWGDNGTGAWQIPDPVEVFDPQQYADPKQAAEEFVRRMRLQDELTDDAALALVAPVVDELLERLQRHVVPYLEQYLVYKACTP